MCRGRAMPTTNTFPTWHLAQPFRMLAHNGEINTIKGNSNWVLSHETRALSDNFTKKLQFNNLVELRKEIINEYPLTKEINTLPSISDISFPISSTDMLGHEYKEKSFFQINFLIFIYG